MYFFIVALCASKSAGFWFQASSNYLKLMFLIEKYKALQTK